MTKRAENNREISKRSGDAAFLADGATVLTGIIAINRSDSNVFLGRNQDRFENLRFPLALDASFGVK